MGKPEDGAVQRRSFLKSIGLAGAAATLPGAALAQGQATTPMPMAPAMAQVAKPAAAGETPALFFDPDEAAFITAAVDILIPADEVGPGAVLAGVPVYIDRQMAGAFGMGDRLYLQGPFAEGTPQQGYQLPLTPSELMRAGIADVEAYCVANHHAGFRHLAPADRTQVLTALETGNAALGTVPARVWFNQLLELTMEGYFADPLYGGNRDKAVWKMIGFPGVAGMYADDVETYRNKPYPMQPKSIRDLI